MAGKMKRGLGMGLDALFAETDSSYENAGNSEGSGETKIVERVVEKVVEKIVQVPATTEVSLSLIDANPNQPRKNFDENALQELADSIKIHGIIQPIVLNKTDSERYLIIAGERRVRAARLLGLDTVPAVVKEYSPQKVKEISIIENLQREDLNAVEAARAIKQLMDEFRFTQEAVAERLGKSRPAIANTLRLLTLNSNVLDMIECGKISAGHARTLVGISDPVLQMELAKKTVAEDLSVRDLEKLVKLTLAPVEQKPEKQKEEAPQSLELKDLHTQLERVFATKIKIIGNDNKGRISIDYFNRDDLDRISDLLKLLETKNLFLKKL